MVSDSVGYSPRDSSPNASVVHNGQVWILGGWRNVNDTVFQSESDVWRSDDGASWDLVAKHPPYSPYSAFTSFHGFIWAFGPTSFRSRDGILWDTVQTNILVAAGSKVTIFRDEIWLINGRGVFRSADGYDWKTVQQDTPWGYRAWPGFLAFHDKLWFFGGGTNYLTGNDYYHKDVWSSEDGYEWVLETPSAAWPGRYYFGYHVYDDKIWILGGWNYYDTASAAYGNRNDAWYTENGVDWFQLPTENSWPERHALFVWVFDGSMWISSGYGGLGKNTLYNDVWKLTNSWRESRIEQVIVVNDTIDYGMALPLELDASSGLPLLISMESGSFEDLSVAVGGQVEPGEYTLHYASFGNSIFAALDTSVTVVVRKKDLIISVPDYSRVFGSGNPGFELHFEGFVYDDTVTAIEEIPSPVTMATLYSPEGIYDIELEGGYSSKYNLIKVPGHLHVESSRLEVLAYPIPVVNDLNVSISQQGVSRIQLINSGGQILSDLSVNESQFALDFEGFAPGIYFLRAFSGNEAEIIRILKR